MSIFLQDMLEKNNFRFSNTRKSEQQNNLKIKSPLLSFMSSTAILSSRKKVVLHLYRKKIIILYQFYSSEKKLELLLT